MKNSTFSFGMMPRLMLLTVLLWVTGAMSAATDYGFWVGSVKVTSDNCNKITGKSIEYGSISYDPDKKKLTIDGAKIAGSGSGGDVIHNQSCYGLQVELWGENEFSAKDIEAFNCEEKTNIIVRSGKTTIETQKDSKPAILIQKSATCSIEVRKGELSINSAGYGVDGKTTGTLFFYAGGDGINIDAQKGAIVNMKQFNVYAYEGKCYVRLGPTTSAKLYILNEVQNMNYTNYEDVYPGQPVITSPTSECVFNPNWKSICYDYTSSAVFAKPIIFSNDYGAILNEHFFPDAIFRNFVSNKLGYGVVYSKSRMEFITELDVSMKNINSLEGIQYFKQLETLYCYFNNLTTFDYNLPKLTHLDINTNKLTTLSTANLPKLTSLVCALNQLTSLTIPQGLKELNCRGNKLASLTAENIVLNHLETMDCGENNFTELDFQTLTYLKELDCNGCPYLKTIYFRNNKNLKDLMINNAPALEELKFSMCGLEHLTLWANSLKRLDIYDCPFTSLNLSGIPNLTYLRIDECSNISTLDFTNLTQIKEMEITLCSKIKTLDLTPLTELETLDCSWNSLTSLDLSNNTKLKYLNAFNNSIGSLDLRNCTSLGQVYCARNKITSLLMPKTYNLAYVSCYRNNIKGDAMKALIESLPNRRSMSTGSLIVHFEPKSYEGNFCTKDNVDAAWMKNWKTYQCEIVNYDEYLTQFYGDYLKGDINGDGEVNTTDITALYNVMFGTNTTINENICDLDGNGTVNTSDVTELYNIIFGTAQ